jgi:hypothetical protein
MTSRRLFVSDDDLKGKEEKRRGEERREEERREEGIR